MAIIGLLDWDLTKWRQPTVFNLELMKLAYYHKVIRRDIVQMERVFDSSMCTKVMIRKDYEDYLYPENIVKDPKTIYGGLALTNGDYIPLAQEIEECPADTSIYSGFESYYKRTNGEFKIYKNLLNATHLRVSADNKTVMPNWEYQLKESDGKMRHIIIHDKNLQNVKDAKEVITDITAYYGREKSRFGFKFPVNVSDPDDMFFWSRILKSPGITNINFVEPIPDDIITRMIGTPQTYTYYITKPNWTEKRLLDSLPHIFMQGLFLSRSDINLLLKVDRNVSDNQMLLKLCALLNDYFRNCCHYHKALVFSCYTYTKFSYFKLQTDQKVELFSWVRQVIPELFDLFYNVEYVEISHGRLIPHMYTHLEIEKGGGYGGENYQREHSRKDQSEQFNYAELILPDELYIE